MATPCSLFAFHEVVRLGALWKWILFVGLGEGFLFFMKHAPLSPWESDLSLF